MKIHKILPGLLLLTVLVARGATAPAIPLEIAITANDSMKFSVTTFNAHSGQVVHVTLTNNGTLPRDVMGHNWILLKAGRDPSAYITAAMTAVKEGYQPASHADEVLASIALLGAKKSGEVTFTAPETPGRYVYLCSFPAHFQAGMKGELIVK